MIFQNRLRLVVAFVIGCITSVFASVSYAKQDQESSTSKDRDRKQEIELGSRIARGGFQNENDIRDKFNNWKQDEDARAWLAEMKFDLSEVIEVQAVKPHGQKADVELTVKTRDKVYRQGISIKLVSNPRGFNQIDKRWLRTYAQMWAMPKEVHNALKLFVGEKSAAAPGHDPKRLYLNELDKPTQQLVIDFFQRNRRQIIDDLFAGDGEHAASWVMVTLKEEQKARGSFDRKTRWMLCPTKVAADFFGEGPIQITAAGNLKIGRITMQRKGGDNGRESANMLQFKINPVDLFSMRDQDHDQGYDQGRK